MSLVIGVRVRVRVGESIRVARVGKRYRQREGIEAGLRSVRLVPGIAVTANAVAILCFHRNTMTWRQRACMRVIGSGKGSRSNESMYFIWPQCSRPAKEYVPTLMCVPILPDNKSVGLLARLHGQ